MAMGDVGFAESIAFFRSTVIGSEISLFAVSCGVSKYIRFSLIVAILEELPEQIKTIINHGGYK
jgi:hypothetical protein